MLGAKGWVSGLGVAFPKEDCAIWELSQQGRYEEALEIYRWYMPLLHFDVVPKLVHLMKLTSKAVSPSPTPNAWKGIRRSPEAD